MEHFLYKLIDETLFFMDIFSGNSKIADMLLLFLLIFLSEELFFFFFKENGRKQPYSALSHIWIMSQESHMHALISPSMIKFW